MKSNRQIGLDGKIFVSGCLRRGPIFVFLLMIGGLVGAVADIIKLTGESGAQLDALTTSLFLFDLVSSFLLVAVMFYAYFLECGTSVPLFKQKPLVWFGFFRIGYHLLTAYYIGQRAFLCMINPAMPVSLAAFYVVYLLWLCALIIANCYLFNVLIKNSIRRNYEKEFKYLAYFGLVVQGLLFLWYIIAALTTKRVEDAFFGHRFCDFLRLCLRPIFSIGIWFLFLNSIDEVKMVFSQVDSALRERRYQIAYADGHEYGAAQRSVYTSALPVPKQPAQAPLSEGKENSEEETGESQVQAQTEAENPEESEELVEVWENDSEPSGSEAEGSQSAEPEDEAAENGEESENFAEQGFEEVDIAGLELPEEASLQGTKEPETVEEEEEAVTVASNVQISASNEESSKPRYYESEAAARLRAAREAAEERRKNAPQSQQKRTTVHPHQTDSTTAQRRAAAQRASAGNAARRAQSSGGGKDRGRR